MRDKLRTILGLKSGEESMVSMLLTQSIFLGIFIGAFDIAAHSLLLSTFNEKIMARGYIVSGGAGIILTSFYAFLYKRVHFRNFAVFNLILVTVLTFFLWSVLIFSPAKWIIFMVFIMLGPLNFMVLSGFRGTADRLFQANRGKRLFRLAETGVILGIIIISFAIPVILSFKFHTKIILLFSATSVFIATIIQIAIRKQFSLFALNGEQYAEKSENRKSPLVVFRENAYIRTIIIFTILSVLTLFFIQYLFMAITREQFPVAEDLAGFLGLFTGSMMIFILIVKLVVFPYVLRNYGLRTCLIISPVLITVFTIVLIATGMFLGYSPEAASGFMIFFLLLVVTRLISKSLRDSIEFPLFKVIYQSIDIKVKSEIRSGMTVTVHEMSLFFSGLILTGLGLFSFIRLIHFSLFLFVIVLIWLFVAHRLFREYRKSIIKETENKVWAESEVDVSNKHNTLKNRLSAYIDFRTDYFSLISDDFSVLNKRFNKWYFEEMINYAGSNKDINLLPALKKTLKIARLDEGVRQHSAEMVEILQKDLNLLKSDNVRINEARKILSGSRVPQTTEILRLFRDNSIESKRLAIYMIGKFRLTDLISDVCICLSVPGLEKDAYEILKSFGSDAEDELVRLYLGTSGNTKLSKTILQLLGNTCTKESIGFLFSRLWSNSRQLKEITVRYLLDCKFNPSEEEKQRLHQLISDVIGSITWNLSAKISLERDNDNFLCEEINHETERWKRFLFNILSITYNSGCIATIRKNFELETMESVSYAVEMTDIVVSDSIKQKLIFLLEVIPDEDKVMKLFQFFPGEIPAHKKLLDDIINRDYNLISLWTKACTLRSIERIEGNDMAESVTALLFSPEELIQEESANLIGRSKPELYFSASKRIPYSIKTRLDNIINGTIHKEEFLFEKVRFLSKCFGVIAEDDLLSVASEMKYIKNIDSESGQYSEACIIWPFSDNNRSNEVHVVYNGVIEMLTRKYQNGNNLSFYLLPLRAVEEYHYQFPDKSFEILKYIDINEEE